MPNTPSGLSTAWANSRTPAATVHTRRGGLGNRSDLATSSASCSKTPALNRSHSPGSREGGNSPGSARTSPDAELVRHHRRALGDLAAETAGPLNDVKIARPLITAGDVSQEGLGVLACGRENGDDVARMGPLNVVARSPVVPDQPAGVRGDAAGRAHEDRRIRAEQDVTASGQARQQRLEGAPVALVVFDDHGRGPVQGPPCLKPESRLAAELREPSCQGQAGPDAHGQSWRLISYRPQSKMCAGPRRPRSPGPPPAAPRRRRPSAGCGRRERLAASSVSAPPLV